MKSLPEYIKRKRVGPGELTYFHYHKPEKYTDYCEQTLKQVSDLDKNLDHQNSPIVAHPWMGRI